AEAYGMVNKAFDPEEIGPYVDALAKRIAKFPAGSINACKQAVYESIDRPIDEALHGEAYWLYQAASQTPAVARFRAADEQKLQFDLENQRNWERLVVAVQG
ncbi:MAG: enoyl-CoA hydratase/isomerase family protein, partial [Planctomycetota bacterium]